MAARSAVSRPAPGRRRRLPAAAAAPPGHWAPAALCWCAWLRCAAAAAAAAASAVVAPGGEPGRPRGCARAAIIVAHADDEAFFAGELLSGRRAALPGGCRRADWLVVVATSGADRDRVRDVDRALHHAKVRGLATSISLEVWDYVDCNGHASCMEFYGGGPIPIVDRIRQVLTERGPFDFVLTHNFQGEYSHLQHKGLHLRVREALTKLAQESPAQKPVLLVFNPLPELNASVSGPKMMMGLSYISDVKNVKRPRLLLFNSLMRYTEHVIPVDYFQRQEPIMLSYFPGSVDGSHELPHFQYMWSAVRLIRNNWGEMGPFSSTEAKKMVDEYLRYVHDVSCTGSPTAAWYPDVCTHLRRYLAGDEGQFYLRNMLGRMDKMIQREKEHMMWEKEREAGLKAAEMHASAVASEAPTGPATRRCVLTAPVGRFGSLGGWTVTASPAPKNIWLELLHIRPIQVGWKQGYKGQTYKVMASSGPVSVDLLSGVARVPATTPLGLQPQDLLGYGVWSPASAARGASSTDALPQQRGRAETKQWRCIGSKGCDDAGLCVFDAARGSGREEDGSILSLAAELGPRPAAARRPKPAPFEVRPALDLTAYVEPTTSYEEFLSLRQRLRHPDLGNFEDKIRLRRDLLPSLGVAATPSIHLSNTDFDVARHLEGRRSFVVKPSHMSESQFVFVVQDGVNLLQKAWGHPDPRVTPRQIQDAVSTFKNSTALDWECKALVGVPSGVVVEELVLGQSPSGQLSVDEYKFYTVWGEVVFGESVPFSSGAAMEIARNGHVLTSRAPCPPYCVSECYSDMVQIAEKVARGAKTDFLRVDILVGGRCQGLYVSEVELFPASDFSPELKQIVAERWRWGYGLSGS